jgi:hypothetical protein
MTKVDVGYGLVLDDSGSDYKWENDYLKKEGEKEFLLVNLSRLIWPDYGKTPEQLMEEDFRENPEWAWRRCFVRGFDVPWEEYLKWQRKLYRKLHWWESWVLVSVEDPPVGPRSFWVTREALDHYLAKEEERKKKEEGA